MGFLCIDQNSSFLLLLSFRIGMALKVHSSCWVLAGAVYLFPFFSHYGFILLPFSTLAPLVVGVTCLLILLL